MSDISRRSALKTMASIAALTVPTFNALAFDAPSYIDGILASGADMRVMQDGSGYFTGCEGVDWDAYIEVRERTAAARKFCPEWDEQVRDELMRRKRFA